MLILKNKSIKILMVVVIILVVIGSIFYHFLEKLSWIDSIYFSSMTLTTIGYGDIYPTHDVSKIFTIFYGFIGVVVLLSFINTLTKHRVKEILKNKEIKH